MGLALPNSLYANTGTFALALLLFLRTKSHRIDGVSVESPCCVATALPGPALPLSYLPPIESPTLAQLVLYSYIL